MGDSYAGGSCVMYHIDRSTWDHLSEVYIRTVAELVQRLLSGMQESAALTVSLLAPNTLPFCFQLMTRANERLVSTA